MPGYHRKVPSGQNLIRYLSSIFETTSGPFSGACFEHEDDYIGRCRRPTITCITQFLGRPYPPAVTGNKLAARMLN